MRITHVGNSIRDGATHEFDPSLPRKEIKCGETLVHKQTENSLINDQHSKK